MISDNMTLGVTASGTAGQVFDIALVQMEGTCKRKAVLLAVSAKDLGIRYGAFCLDGHFICRSLPQCYVGLSLLSGKQSSATLDLRAARLGEAEAAVSLFGRSNTRIEKGHLLQRTSSQEASPAVALLHTCFASPKNLPC